MAKKQSDFVVALRYTLKAQDATDAENKVRTKLGLPKKTRKTDPLEVLGVSCKVIEQPVVLSDEMGRFLEAEVNNCEESGENPTLDVAQNSLNQMPDDILTTICLYGDEDNPTPEQLGEKIIAELAELIAKYGRDSYIENLLLP